MAPPATPTPIHEIAAALRIIPPLNGLTDSEYIWLATHGTELVGADGSFVFEEGGPCDRLHFILRGEIQVRRRNSGTFALFIGRAGQMTGKLPFSRMKTYGGDGVTVGPAWSLSIHESLFPEMLSAIPSMTQRCVSTLLDRVREVTRMEQQAEKLAALGKLAANLAHELNNPASAAQRSAASLFGELRQYGDQKYKLGSLCLTEEQSAEYRNWVARTRASMASYTPPLDSSNPLATSDREDSLLRWLESHNISSPWTIAPALAETNITLAHLDDFASVAAPNVLPLALATFASSLRVERMAETVVNSTVRIFDLISAIKDYSYMDQAPIQDVDLAQSLDNTLAMFASRLEGITVEKDFDPTLPPVSAYGSELNQVFTALIENALEAMSSKPSTDSSTGTPPNGTSNATQNHTQPGSANGTLKLVTRLTGTTAIVEIWDSGPGIHPDHKSRIFEPFFTTKPPGHGLGLGLDTAQRIVSRHSGILTVHSRPGETCFEVRIPLDQAQAY